MKKEDLIKNALDKLEEQASSVDSHMIFAVGPGGTILRQIAKPILEELVQQIQEL